VCAFLIVKFFHFYYILLTQNLSLFLILFLSISRVKCASPCWETTNFWKAGSLLLKDGTWQIKSNEELNRLTGNKNIINYIKAQRLAWFGHIHRMPDNTLHKGKEEMIGTNLLRHWKET
jgi:hypothetical protein